MAQYGADVIKVEPHEGDWGRRISKSYDGHSAYSVPTNMGKRSLALDLKTEEGRDVMQRLLADADLFIEGFRPGIAARLGVGYDAVSAQNSGILYLSISGFGQQGPLRDRPAMDPVLQAFSGLMSVNKGNDGIPHRIGVIVCDMSTALYAFQAVSVSLYARRDEAAGRYIEANLMQGVACLQVVRMISNYMDGGRTVPGRVPSGTFPTADGWVNILIFKEEEFPALCEIIGEPALATDPRFATNAARLENEAALVPLLNEALGRIPGATLSEGMAKARIMHEQVNDFFEFLKHPQVDATGLITWVDHPGLGKIPMPNAPGIQRLANGNPLSVAPGVGEHSADILAEHGYGDVEISALIERNVVSA
ncbi:MAG: CoA transferase, partial [Alphaproteobacteria bacterium]|nr:CoA transferase [Alphaproteobacteria bacterium]